MINLSQKGISLYIAVVILSIILAIVLGLNTILLGQIKMIRGIGYSEIAFYTADTGAERGFFKIGTCNGSDPDPIICDCDPDSNDCVYAASLDLNGSDDEWSSDNPNACPDLLTDPDDSCYKFRKFNINDCPGATDYCFRIMGYYKGTRRAIELAD